jgi:hypothetical protein
MTPEERTSVKKAYFDLLDLIIKYRIKEVMGKTGPTYIPKIEVKDIIDLKFKTSLDVLYRDKILGTFKKDGNEIIFDEVEHEGQKTILFDCLKTVEEMGLYKNSLIVEEGWPSVEVVVLGSDASLHYKIRRRNGSNKTEQLSNKEGDFLTYLLTNNNKEKSRKIIAKETKLSGDKISNFKNVIRRKLIKLDFSKEEVEKMMPPYKR